MRHPWRITVPAQATRHPPAKCPVRAVGRTGVRRLGRAVPKPACWGSSFPGRSTPCVDALAFRTAPAAYGVALPRCRRADDGEQVVSCQVGPSQAKRSKAKPRPPCLGSYPARQPCVYGMAWVGWRDRKAPWMAHFEPPWVRAHCLRGIASHAFERTAASGWAGPRSGVHGGSRDPTHAVPPRTNLKCRFCSGSAYRYTATANTSHAARRTPAPLYSGYRVALEAIETLQHQWLEG